MRSVALAPRIVLVHRHFPGQFRYLVMAWLRSGVVIDAIGARPAEEVGALLQPQDQPLSFTYWELPDPLAPASAPLDADLESALRRGEALAELARGLRDGEGLHPDAVICHSGWGEGLHLHAVWPKAVLLAYPELYGSPRCLGYGFDPRQPPISPQLEACIDRQNLLASAAVLGADGAVVPTRFQRDSFPAPLQGRLHLIHEGIDASLACPNSEARFHCGEGLVLRPGDPVITVACRSLEPLRGIQPMLEALPALMRARPDLQVVLAGHATRPGYGGVSSHPGGFLGELLEQLQGRLDFSRLHAVGWLPLDQLIALFQVSAAHIYLSYPYTLSWSVLQAMACGAAVVGNGDGPLAEVIEPGRNGLLVNFNDPPALAGAVLRLLQDPAWRRALGAEARRTVQQRFAVDWAAEAYLDLISQLAKPCSTASTSPGQSPAAG